MDKAATLGLFDNQTTFYSMQQFSAHLHDEAGTAALGAALARAIAPGLALTRALLHAAGQTGHVKSPTYTLSEPYCITLDGRRVNLIHFDLYRMGSPEEFLDAGFREEFNGDNICIVEWPERGAPVLPPPDLNVFLAVSGEGRDVKLQASSESGLSCLLRLKFAPNL